ncbi:MAG TPA: hypothetical protein VD793_09105, partial [Gemmatimonadales bacterium]|nr:hypothetical protein [Gemmatimonadales bacterium]
ARRPTLGDRLVMLTRQVWSVLSPAHQPGVWGMRLAGGGSVVALVGADGSGKSTCAAALTTWLAQQLQVRPFHFGRPPRSAGTLVAGALLRLTARAGRNLREHARLLRCLAVARDRYRMYRRARRLAAGGGIAICERYPMPDNWALVGPSTHQGVALAAQGLLARWLRQREMEYYRRLAPPDRIFALRVEPDVAVARKISEPADYVRARARLMYNTNWSHCGAVVLDAGQPLRDVLARLRRHVWETL